MSDPLARLAPRSLWSLFSHIAGIPRPSKHEQRIVAWIRTLAGENGFAVRSDAVGNLVLDVPASPGREGCQTVILQAHLDMVCEKNKDSDHDFMRDPIRPRIDGDWVYATGTTLGADNGIGVAAALAAATDSSVVHGPLQLLFTLDEETGLTGAAGLDGSLLDGRILINMDSEEDGIVFVGCAGGADSHLFLDVGRTTPNDGGAAQRLEITGLVGGHSGLNIHENRGNALKLGARVIMAAIEEGLDVGLGSLRGGAMHNAIPREAEFDLWLAPQDGDRFRAVLARMVEGFRTELENVDDGLQVRLAPTESDGAPLAPADRDRLLSLLLALPHGVLAMSGDIPGLVETSSNLAAVSETDGRIRIVTSSRSSIGSAMEEVLARIRSVARLAGAKVETHDGYPGWKPDMGSAVLQVVREVYTEIWGKEPEVTAVHAGLECGLLAEKAPGLDMISFGPQIEGAHSPDERAHIGSVERFWKALCRVLDRLATAA